MKEEAGRNGGRLKRLEKGDPANEGAGRPVGSKSFKTLLEEALEKTTKTKSGETLSLKTASAIQLVAILISPETDDNTKLKAFQIIRDTIGEAPILKTENLNTNLNTESQILTAEQIAGIDALLEGNQKQDNDKPVPGKQKGK